MQVVFSERCLEYGRDHVENPRRVVRIVKSLKSSGFGFVDPDPAPEDLLEEVHAREYLEALAEGREYDPDTPAYPGIYEIARLAAGGAVTAARISGFSVMRPPGHHAGIRGRALGAATKGFCYLNNIAVAVRSLGGRTLILDIDGHHGNGTQEIFEGDPSVFYISLHRFPLYPGTGTCSGDNYLNFPLPAECGEALYLRTLRKALSFVNVERFDVIAVSVGFDAHEGDLASLGLTSESYRRIGEIIGRLGKKTFFVLEGGYHELIGEDALNLITGFLRAMETRS